MSMSTSKSSVQEKKKTYGAPVKSTKSYGGGETQQQSSSKSSQKSTKKSFEKTLGQKIKDPRTAGPTIDPWKINLKPDIFRN